MSLKEHLKTTEENRNQTWDEQFFKMFSEAQLNILSDDPQPGPDGWPYLMSELSFDKLDNEQKIDSAQKVIQWLSTRGIGLVVNPARAPYPDYVFSYGMIWSFRETGFFIKYNLVEQTKNFTIDPQKGVLTGPPTEVYLPLYVRAIIKDFFRDQTVFDPRVLMISIDGKHYDLCFSLESVGSPVAEEHEGILEAISWFLPPHYSVALISEKGLPAFESL